MRVVGVSRVLDEADVIEPFIRHHAALLDQHIVLDNGSTDGTLDILRALHGEGIKLQVYQTESVIFLEQSYNTGLYRLALGEGADWVMFLDADELLVVREAARPDAVLSLVPEGVACLRLYAHACPRPDPGAHPFAALRRRARAPEMPKVAIRRLAPDRVAVYAGNHYCFIDGVEDPGLAQDRLWLAHVSDRSPLQLARKSIAARIKQIASGRDPAGLFGTHRIAAFEALKTAPREWLAAQEASEPPDLIDDEISYLGGPLRYTTPPDELARLISLLSVQAEQVARSHGAILDGKRLIRNEILRKGAEIRRLF